MFDEKPVPHSFDELSIGTNEEIAAAIHQHTVNEREKFIRDFGGDEKAADEFIHKVIDKYRQRVGLPPI